MPRVPWPPLLVGAALAGTWALGRFAPEALRGWTDLPAARSFHGAGYALIAAALLVEVTALWGLARRGTTVLPHREAQALVTAGLHSYSRNPIYVAHVCLVAGFALTRGSALGLGLAALTGLALDRLAVRPEERFLRARFGAAFDDYTARVPRWIGRVRRDAR